MFPLSGLLGLGSSIFDFFGSSGAADDAQEVAQQNLNWQKDRFWDLYNLLTAPQRDAYGNVMTYRPGGIGWDFNLTPETESILSGEQQEQIKSLTEDANRNRNYRRRMEGVSKDAGREYENVMADYRYGPKPDQQSIIDDLTRLMTINRTKGMEEGGTVLAQQALRQESNPALLGSIGRSLDETWGKSLEESIIQGRQLGQKEYQSRNEARNRDLSGWLQHFYGINKGQPQANIIDPTIGETLSGMVQPANSSASSGITSGMGLINSAAGMLANKAGVAPPSTGGIAKSIGSLFGGGGSGAGSASSFGSGTASFGAPEAASARTVGNQGGTIKIPQSSGIVTSNPGDIPENDPSSNRFVGGQYTFPPPGDPFWDTMPLY